MDLSAALLSLDPQVEDHWTANGLPRMDAIHALTGDETITRQAVTNAAPDLSRETAAWPPTPQPTAMEPAPEQEPAAADDGAAEDVAQEAPETAPAELAADESRAYAADVLDMPIAQVLRDPHLTDCAIIALDQKIVDLLRERDAVQSEIDRLNAHNEIVKRAATMHERNRPASERDRHLKDYLRVQREAREERALRARKFIEAQTSPQAVAEQLAVGSKLDQAMRHRRPSRGSQRPTRTAVHA